MRELFRRTAPSISRLTLDGADGKRETLNVTSEHPFFVEGKGWLEVRRLQKGDRVISEKNALLAVADITHDDKPTTVHNFEVAQDHNYFVGEVGAEAHNARIRKSPKEIDDIFDALGGKCPLCGNQMRRRVPPRGPRADVISCDHIIPQSEGGTDDPSNLRHICLSCNAGRR